MFRDNATENKHFGEICILVFSMLMIAQIAFTIIYSFIFPIWVSKRKSQEKIEPITTTTKVNRDHIYSHVDNELQNNSAQPNL